MTLAQHVGLREVVDSHVDLGDAPGRANPGDKLLTLVASALAGGDFIDDADVLRTGGDSWRHRLCSQGAIHPGNFPAQLPVGPRPPVGSGEPGVAVPGLGRWDRTRRRAVDHRPRLDHLRDLPTGQGGGASPWLHWPTGISPAAGHRRRHRVKMLMSRLREGRDNTVRGAAHFLRETVGRVRHAGARGQLTVRADSGFYAHALVVVCREMDVRFSRTIRQHARLRELIEAIPEEDWTPVPYWMDGGADVAETTYTPFQD